MNTLFVLLAAVPLAILAAGLRRVPAQNARPVRRFGRHRRVLGPGWHWVLPLVDRIGREVDLVGHRVQVESDTQARKAVLYYQILEPDKAGATLEAVDDFVARQAREVLVQASQGPDQLKLELNRRVERLGLRVIRCSLLVA